MSEWQRTVKATTAIALLIAALFYVPWRVNATGELRWAPFYRNPVVNQSTLTPYGPAARFIRLKGQRAFGVYFLQLGALGALGAIAFRMAGDRDESDRDPD